MRWVGIPPSGLRAVTRAGKSFRARRWILCGLTRSRVRRFTRNAVCAVTYLKPDYLIGSAHFVEVDGILFNSHDLKKASKVEQQKLLTRYWQNVRGAANSGLFTFLAHLDLMKKVGLGQEDSWAEEELKTVQAIKKAGVMVELNTSAFKRGDEPYPSRRIMQMLANENVKVILSDDAHDVARLGADFDRAYAIAKDCGIKNFYGEGAVKVHSKEISVF